jgi:integrase
MWFHDLRYSAETFLAVARVDMKVAQERLGHGTIATAADISIHVSLKMQHDAVEKINDLFKHP